MLPLFKIDDRKVKEIIKNVVGSKEGDFNGQSMMCGTTVNPVIVVNPVPEFEFVHYSVTAVQNTWYELCHLYNVEVDYVSVLMATADEDLELKINVDGYEAVGTKAPATFGTNYYVRTSPGSVWAIVLDSSASLVLLAKSVIKCKDFKVQIRKTSANGANLLHGYVEYMQW